MKNASLESVIVTGSGGNGCGRAIAERFARERAAVIVSDIDDHGGHVTVDRIRDAGGRAEFCRADVRDEADLKRLIAFAEERLGRLDVLVNNASGPFRPNEPLEHWVDTVQTELLGTMRATRYAIDDVAGMVLRLATDQSLSGRVAVWWSDKEPELIEWADRGYERSEPFTRGSA